MSLGQIPVSSRLRVYYKLEDTSDSTSNARNLTNVNSVSFSGIGRFATNAADFGSSGTNKGLQYSGDAFGANVTDIHFWFKLNNTSSANSPARLFTHTSSNYNLVSQYSLSGGNVTISAILGSGTASITITADTNWHYVRINRSSTTVLIRVDMSNAVSASGSIGTGSNLLTIGNNAALTAQGWVTIDEMFIADGNYSLSELYRYYTQAKGRFCI